MKAWLLGLFAMLMTFAGTASAALPADITTALTEAKDNGVAIATAVLGIVVTIAAYKYAKRAL